MLRFQYYQKGSFIGDDHVLFHTWKINLSQCILLFSPLKFYCSTFQGFGGKFSVAQHVHSCKRRVLSLKSSIFQSTFFYCNNLLAHLCLLRRVHLFGFVGLFGSTNVVNPRNASCSTYTPLITEYRCVLGERRKLTSPQPHSFTYDFLRNVLQSLGT